MALVEKNLKKIKILRKTENFIMELLYKKTMYPYLLEICNSSAQFSSVAQLCPTICDPVDHHSQASLFITNSQSLPKLMCIELAMPSNHLILCCPLLLLSSIFISIRVFSNESALHIRWPKYSSFSFNITPSKGHSALIPLRWTGWISLQSKGLSKVFTNATVQKHQFFGVQLFL